MWHGSQCCSHDDRNSLSFLSPHPGLCQPFVRLFGCLMFFSAGTDTSAGWYPVCWLAHLWICWSYRTVHEPTVITGVGINPWLVHSFHDHDRYSSGNIDKFYCASPDIHVLPISDNRKLNNRLFPAAIDKFDTCRLDGPLKFPFHSSQGFVLSSSDKSFRFNRFSVLFLLTSEAFTLFKYCPCSFFCSHLPFSFFWDWALLS